MKIKRKKTFAIIVAIILTAALGILKYFNLLPQKVYYDEHFGIKTIYSKNDCNQNGIDDYTDILLGARQDAKNRPKYKSQYYAGGYPPEYEGVCTDVVWRAFKNAGYTLKDMVDEDIKNNVDLYPAVGGKPDPNIDFRRVRNLKVFFDRHAVSYTLDPYKIEEWQRGDIVIFGENYSHIGIISDKRDARGIPFLIHNAGQPVREEDALIGWYKAAKITGHYRFENSSYSSR